MNFNYCLLSVAYGIRRPFLRSNFSLETRQQFPMAVLMLACPYTQKIYSNIRFSRVNLFGLIAEQTRLLIGS